MVISHWAWPACGPETVHRPVSRIIGTGQRPARGCAARDLNRTAVKSPLVSVPPRRQRRAADRDAAKKRKRGGQPGAPGASMSRKVPDRTEDHYPEGRCLCGAALGRG